MWYRATAWLISMSDEDAVTDRLYYTDSGVGAIVCVL